MSYSTYTAEGTEEFEPGPCPLCEREDVEVTWIDVAAYGSPDAYIPRVECVCGAVNANSHWRYR